MTEPSVAVAVDESGAVSAETGGAGRDSSAAADGAGAAGSAAPATAAPHLAGPLKPIVSATTTPSPASATSWDPATGGAGATVSVVPGPDHGGARADTSVPVAGVEAAGPRVDLPPGGVGRSTEARGGAGVGVVAGRVADNGPVFTPVATSAAVYTVDGEFRDDEDDSDEEDVVVKLNNVHKTYLLGIEGVAALRGVSFSVKRGEFLMLVGKSGSGKTSMLNIIGTIDKPTRGSLTLCGTRVTSATTDYDLAQLRLRRLGFVFQTFNLLQSMTALENVEMPMTLAAVPASKRRERAAALLHSVGIGARMGHTPAQLSGGEQQRVTIARALANQPSILLLDEPTGDLDTKNSDIVMRFLVDLNQNKNVTLVMVTHEMSLRAYSNRVIHMLDGKVQKETITPPAKRAEALRALRERTQASEVISGAADLLQPDAAPRRPGDAVTPLTPVAATPMPAHAGAAAGAAPGLRPAAALAAAAVTDEPVPERRACNSYPSFAVRA